MKVQFEATIEDFVDVAVRASPLTWEYYLILGSTILGSGLFFGFLTHCLYASPAATAIAVIIAIVFVAASNYKIRERRARSFIAETYHPKWPAAVEAEISDAGLSFKQFGTTTVYDWEIVSSIGEDGDAIYFQNLFGQISAVRTRAFASESEKNEFIQTATQYISQSREPVK
jgi:hypothetical protein